MTKVVINCNIDVLAVAQEKLARHIKEEHMNEEAQKKYDEFYNSALENGVPEHLVGGLTRYVIMGINPGDFLTAVLSNDLMEAFGRADRNSLAGLEGLMKFIYNYVPSACHGSKEKVSAWKGGGYVC